jgi:hypothetical protein
MEAYPLFRKNLECLKSVLNVTSREVFLFDIRKVSPDVPYTEILLSNKNPNVLNKEDIEYHSIVFYLCNFTLKIHHESENDVLKTLEMMKLFHMDSALELLKEPSKFIYWNPLSIYVPSLYVIDISFMNNIFYTMIFGLILTTDINDIKKYLSVSAEKYKLLSYLNYLPSELNREISSYFIYFLFMQCHIAN